MHSETEEYKRFIDRIAIIEGSVSHKIKKLASDRSWNRAQRSEDSQFIKDMTDEQLDTILRLIEDFCECAIHDVLVIIENDGYELKRNGVSLAKNPFGNPIFYDFVARRMQEEWPEE